MALTLDQETWLEDYTKIPCKVNRFFRRRIAQGKIAFVTNALTINYEEIKEQAHKAKILRRIDDFPTAKLNGSVIKSVTPEPLKDSIPFMPEDQLNRQAGQPTYVNGKKIDNATFERDRRIESLKKSVETLSEEVAAAVYLEGKFLSADTGNSVQYSPFTYKAVAIADITDWAIWITKKINAFVDKNKVAVDEILVGENIFFKILKEYNNKNESLNATPKRALTPEGDYEMTLELFGYTFVMIPPARNPQNNEIDTKNEIRFVNNSAFMPAFAGVTNVTDGKATLEAVDVLIRETSANEKSGMAETLIESAYCPIVVNPNLVVVYEVSGVTLYTGEEKDEDEDGKPAAMSLDADKAEVQIETMDIQGLRNYAFEKGIDLGNYNKKNEILNRIKESISGNEV